jgi:hypothetical protein
MQDTPEHIKQLQLKIWLSKTPGERIIQFVKDNDDFFKFCEQAKAQLLKNNNLHKEDSHNILPSK